MTQDPSVRHKTIEVGGVATFYREAGRHDAPVVLLPHGYPCSSYEFRNFMPEGAARAYQRDAELHLLEDGGHWLLETHLDQTVSRVRSFLERING